MPDIVIKAENLGKKYVIGNQAERGDYTLLRDVLMKILSRITEPSTGRVSINGRVASQSPKPFLSRSFNACR